MFLDFALYHKQTGFSFTIAIREPSYLFDDICTIVSAEVKIMDRSWSFEKELESIPLKRAKRF